MSVKRVRDNPREQSSAKDSPFQNEGQPHQMLVATLMRLLNSLASAAC